ncbi:Protein of unknown function [Rhodoferax sp. OV413]|uniref:DUF2894 domain-containing protein n=1 Tax=Rhodoferax sp. OV413 TaxID=1855285 RepID=UPI00088D8458|nr:DUF2894 domain-containing protein [Rhodoferax sp. OV413]SDO70583.1 Protein of unknown function [Rhodoferax sp. OV413]
MMPPEAFDAAAALASLRSAGAQHGDPVRFRYLEALQQRAQLAPDPVRRILEDKLQTALAAYAGRKPRAHAAESSSPPSSPLAALNAYIRAATQPDAAGNGPPVGWGGQPELKSVQGFREVWSKFAVVDQVEQSLKRGPENAGPLNSHMLVLRSLATMRELSPEYLRRFLSHAETLLWLDQESQRLRAPQTRSARPSRRKKKGDAE